MKSLMMAIFLTSVFVGNTFTGIVNSFIQIDSPTDDADQIAAIAKAGEIEVGTMRQAGFDGDFNTDDDLLIADGEITSPVSDLLAATVAKLQAAYLAADSTLPLEFADLPQDPWGKPLRYRLVSAKEARLSSDGPDGKYKTKWDLGVSVKVHDAEENLEGTWLYEAKKRKGMIEEKVEGQEEEALRLSYTAGGGVTLEGAAYFWFFTRFMIITALLFIPFAILYKPRTYLQGDADSLDEEAASEVH